MFGLLKFEYLCYVINFCNILKEKGYIVLMFRLLVSIEEIFISIYK